MIDYHINNYVDIINRSQPIHMPMGVRLRIATIGISEVELYKKNPAFEENMRKVYIRDLCGIPLTPELLVMAGFVKDGTWWGDGIYYYGNGLIDIRFGSEEIPYKLDTVFFGQQEMPVTYLHQLQNLYQSLTGSELNIQL